MKKIWIIILAALAIRIVLSLTTFHFDMKVFDLAGKIVARGNIFDLYDFSFQDAVLNYPPAIYLLHGIFRLLFNISGLSSITQFNIDLFLIKLPYMFFDFAVGYLFLKLFSLKKAHLAFILWMFNPISLYATYMMGQFDIIPTFFIVLSIYFVTRGKLDFAALALGGGIAFKLSPVFLIVPLLILGRSFSEKIKLLTFSLMPYFITVIPYIFSPSFRSTALFANQSSKSLYASIPVSGGEAIILFPAFLLLYYLIIWGSKFRVDIYKLYLIPLLLFFIFTHYHPQWLIWITPLLIIELLISSFKSLLPVLLIFISWFVSLFFFDSSLTLGMFSAIAPQLQNTLSIWNLLNINVDYNVSRSLIQTIFVGAALYFIYNFFVKLKKSDEAI